jgi:hypothetical protein
VPITEVVSLNPAHGEVYSIQHYRKSVPITEVVSLNPAHGEVYSIQHYVINYGLLYSSLHLRRKGGIKRGVATNEGDSLVHLTSVVNFRGVAFGGKGLIRGVHYIL